MDQYHKTCDHSEKDVVNIVESNFKTHNLENDVPQLNLDSKTELENFKHYSVSENHQESFPKLVVVEPIDITPEKSRGVLKVKNVEGVGDDFPSYGDKVSVNYDGYFLMKGEKVPFHFDTSASCTQFRIGKGEVIKGWDLAVMSMKKGESSLFIIDPSYGYGASGLTNKVPPNTPLLFNIHLQNWKHEDLSPKKDGSILKKMLKQGENSKVPNEGSEVTIKLVGCCNGNIFEDSQKTFILGEGYNACIPEGIEIALYKFNIKESSVIFLKNSFAFPSGTEENDINASTFVSYEVTLLSLKRVKNLWEMNTDEKFKKAEIAKEKGIQCAMIYNYKAAIMHFKWILLCLENEPGADPETIQSRNYLLLAGYLNLALCLLKTKEYKLAISCCNKALEKDDKNEKALFRRGLANLANNETKEALKDFQLICELYPENKIATKYLFQSQQQIKKQEEKDKNIYNNMFDKFAKKDEERIKNMKTETGVWKDKLHVGETQQISETERLIQENDSLLRDANIIELSNNVWKNL